MKLKISPKTKSILKDVALITAGGFVEIFTEFGVDSVATSANLPGWRVNMGDLVGALEGTALVAVGIKMNKPEAVWLGAGGLAVALPNLVGKQVMSYQLNYGVVAQPLRLNTRPVRPTMTNGVAASGYAYPQTSVAGKYTMRSNNVATRAASMGRYR